MSFPIEVHQLYFQCDGCKAQWMNYVDPPITNAQEFEAYMDAGKSGPCPRNCGSRTVSVVMKVARDPDADPNSLRVDPFSIFSKDPKKGS